MRIIHGVFSSVRVKMADHQDQGNDGKWLAATIYWRHTSSFNFMTNAHNPV